jgi:hypothetical protein
MLTHRMILDLTWRLLQRHGPEATLAILGEVLPVMFVSDGRNKTYVDWTSRWWIEQIHRAAAPSPEVLVQLHPELLNPALGAIKNWS